jgi:hypothetical protein
MKSMGKAKEKVEAEAPVELDAFAQSIRFDAKQGAFLKARHDATELPVAEIVRQYVDDARTFYDIPRPQLDKHMADMEALGLSPREYIRYLLSLRYEAIVLGHVSLSEPPASSRKG